MKKKLFILAAAGLLAFVPAGSVYAADFEAAEADAFTDGAEAGEFAEAEETADRAFGNPEFADEEEVVSEKGAEAYAAPWEPTIDLELNKYYKVSEMEVYNNSINNGSIYHMFKAVVPENGRIKIRVEDCNAHIFDPWFSISKFDLKYWWKKGLESYDSGWITVTPGTVTGELIRDYRDELNREAKFIIEYETSREYNGESENNDTYDTANTIVSDVVYEADSSKTWDVDVYKFEMKKAGLANLSLLDKDKEEKLDGILYEEDENGNIYSLLEFETAARMRLKPGRYFLKTKGSTQYTVCAKLEYESSEKFEQEDNNFKSQANKKKVNVWYTGNLNTNKDIDYYRLETKNASDLELEFKTPRGLQSRSIKISLYDKNLELLVSAENTENPYLITEKKRYPAGTYYVRVEDGTDWRENFTDDYTFRLKSTITLAKPVLTDLRQSTVSYQTVLKWKPVKNATGYAVYRKAENGSYKKIATTSGTSYSDKASKVVGNTYTYTVRAYGGPDTVASSSASARKVCICPFKPIIKSLSYYSGGLKVQWDKVSNASGYYVYRKEGSGSWKQIATVGKTASSYTDKSVKKGKTYSYRIYSYKKIGLMEEVWSTASSTLTKKR